jgi:hypothetical protein
MHLVFKERGQREPRFSLKSRKEVKKMNRQKGQKKEHEKKTLEQNVNAPMEDENVVSEEIYYSEFTPLIADEDLDTEPTSEESRHKTEGPKKKSKKS